MITACHNCKKGPSKACVACKRVSQDDIRIQHTPHNRSELQAAQIQQPRGNVTALPEDVEDILLRLLCTVTALDPVDALLLLHVAKGGTPNTFADTLKAIDRELKTYGKRISRATAQAKWNAVISKFAPFAALRSWGIGHGGRKARKRVKAEPRRVQATFDFAED